MLKRKFKLGFEEMKEFHNIDTKEFEGIEDITGELVRVDPKDAEEIEREKLDGEQFEKHLKINDEPAESMESNAIFNVSSRSMEPVEQQTVDQRHRLPIEVEVRDSPVEVSFLGDGNELGVAQEVSIQETLANRKTKGKSKQDYRQGLKNKSFVDKDPY